MALLYALSIAGQSLLTYQSAINTTNKNISNAFSDGYSREEPIIADLPAKSGAYIQDIRRVSSKIVFSRLLNVNQEAEGLDNYKSVLTQIEDVFNETSGAGFGEALNQFFASLNDIAVNPGDIAARYDALSKAKALIGRIRQSYSFLTDIKDKTTLGVKDTIEKVNLLTSKLAKINDNIKFYYNSNPERYNEYLDERDRTLKELSSLIDIKATFNNDGTVNVSTAKGFGLVLDTKNIPLTFETDGDNNPIIKWRGTDITTEFKNGKLGGYLKGINLINGTITRLNTFTTEFANAINNQQQAGFDLNGNPGTDLFVADNGTATVDASNITLGFEDPELIAASSDPTYPDSNNENIKAMISLEDTKISGLGDKSFAEYYTSEIVTPIGTEVSRTDNLISSTTQIRDSLQQQLNEISAVNTDEEFINLTKFQRAYQASAKVVAVTDELIQTVLNMVQ
ncbi:flagellar hook-associated protein FlgK [Desulfurobacterium atlanticum]|uniref:Flagellar hook-associated protein 1 n=1 Tax=Desulfurobacterium atlanticum TaxID=240169 RepID=A0A238YGH0_9BACT|nr:flagellar hook-associated protein FlgK [Desulfurobacterium atlanticum]SNR70072.1 flagellar hook-associated protein 1 FlgK [Desulfurobacterium atlanticum]